MASNHENIHRSKRACIEGSAEEIIENSLRYKKITSELKALYCALGHGLILEHIPKQFVTNEVCLAAIHSNPLALQYVPSWLMNFHLCYLAVNLNGIALQHVPKAFMSEQLCHLAIETERFINDYAEALQYVPKKFLSRSLCMRAVERNSMALKYVPYEFQFPEICLTAVRNCEHHMLEELLEYVKDKNYNFYLSIVKGDTSSLKNEPLKFVPEKAKDMKMCMAAVEADGCQLEFVPNKLKTKKLCVEALKRDGRALEYVPEKLQPELRKWFKWTGGENEAP